MRAGSPRVAVRWAVLGAALSAVTAAVTALLGRSVGEPAARRCGGLMAACLALQHGALAALLWRERLLLPGAGSGPACRLGSADALTLSRGVSAALLAGLAASGVRAGCGPAGWLAWGGLLWGATVSDWLDGPAARRWGGASRLGPLLDLEMDSWLTLAAAFLAVRWKRAPRRSAVPPVARYALLALALRRGAYGSIDLGRTWWARASGTFQMAVLVVGLAPSWPEVNGRLVRAAAGPAAFLQLVSLAALAARFPRRAAPGGRDG